MVLLACLLLLRFLRSLLAIMSFMMKKHFLLDSHGRKIASGCDSTDLKETFDKIDHKILLCKLSRLGFSNRLVSWFSSYLCSWSMCVGHGSYVSSPFISTSGVPQGNNLSPLLFLIFFNDVTTSLGFKC